jgi:hypothetical protein
LELTKRDYLERNSVRLLLLVIEDPTNVNEFENPGSNGDGSLTFRDFALGLDIE